MIAQITFRPSSTASSYRRCLVRLAFLRKSPTRRTLRPARITLPSHRNSPTTYQRLYPVNATSSSRIRPFSFLRVFRYWLDHALITAFLSLIINLTLPPVQTFRAGHFTQISYVRQRMGFTQIFDEAIRHMDKPIDDRYSQHHVQHSLSTPCGRFQPCEDSHDRTRHQRDGAA